MGHSLRRAPLLVVVLAFGCMPAAFSGVASATFRGAVTARPALPPGAVVGTRGKVHFKFLAVVDRLAHPGPPAREVEDPGDDDETEPAGSPRTTGVVPLVVAKVARSHAI